MKSAVTRYIEASKTLVPQQLSKGASKMPTITARKVETAVQRRLAGDAALQHAQQLRAAHDMVGKQVTFSRAMPEALRKLIVADSGTVTHFNGTNASVRVASGCVHDVSPQYLELTQQQ